MKLKSVLTQKLLLLLAPIAASSVLALAPAEAASLARAKAALVIKDLSSDVTKSKVKGDGDRYFAFAQALPTTTFSIEPTKDLSFKFTASLKLKTSVEDADLESANAAGAVFFQVFDTATQVLLDSFTLSGSLMTTGDDFLGEPVGNAHLQLSTVKRKTDFGETATSETASTRIRGFYSREFLEPVALTLVTGELSRACVQAPKAADPCVQVPESSNTLAFVFLVGSLGIVKSRRRSPTKLKSISLQGSL